MVPFPRHTKYMELYVLGVVIIVQESIPFILLSPVKPLFSHSPNLCRKNRKTGLIPVSSLGPFLKHPQTPSLAQAFSFNGLIKFGLIYRSYWLLSELCLKIYLGNKIILIIALSLS